MSMFKKPNRNFRQRKLRQDSDEENNNDDEKEKSSADNEAPQASAAAVPQDAVTKLVEKRKALRSQPVSKPVLPCFATTIITPTGTSASASSVAAAASGTLSFENEEEGEGEVFKVKKSSYSRRLAKQLEKERKKKPNNSDETENSELPMDVSNIKKEKTEEENDIVLNGEQMEEMELGSADEEKEQDAIPDPFKRILESGSIPDAAMIHAARKRRQMAREMSDFVTIEDKESNENSNSRLVRDDDNDRSDDDEEEEGRMSFAVSAAPLAKDRAREALMALNQKDGTQGIDEEADEELERWEQEQIRKGVSILQVVPPQETPSFSSYLYPEALNMYPDAAYTAAIPTNEDVKQEPEESTSIPMAAVTNNLPTFTLEGFKQHLRGRLDSQRQVHRAHERERDKIMDDLVESESRILELEDQSPGVARAFTFYQEMRGYVTDLVECLDEKVVQITMLERGMMQLLKQRAANLVQRRQQDIKDQCEEFANIFSKTAVAPSQDPFNREKAAKDAARARRAAEREGRRTRRRRGREARGTNVSHFDGMSSDDEEMDTDIAQFKAEKERLMGQAETVFEDVIDDFRNFNAIKRRFERWKDEYPESYKNAYIGLCLPKVFTPLVKLQLLSWNPLQETRDFEETRWFESLMFFSYQESHTPSDLKGDADTQLIPLIVERVILPKLKELAEHVWDPMSTSQTLRFVSLLQKLLTEYPTVNGKSKKTQELLQAVANRMRKTLDDDVYMPPYPKAVLENKTLGANTFFQRQYWSCVKLLRNLLSWQGILSDGPLQELALDGLLNRYLLWAMHNSASNKDSLEKAKMITSTIPRCWLSKRNGDSTIPQLDMFCRYLKTSADAMDKTGVNGNFSDKAEAKENIKEIVKMLVNIGAMDHALSLVNQFSLKDLKGMVNNG